MDKYEIKRRTRSDTIYLKLNPFGDPFSIKQEMNLQEMFLLGLGLGIYWGEGEKALKHAIRVANSDPYVLISFSSFLKSICGVKEEKIIYSLVCLMILIIRML
jgi:hypothetical protein